MQRMVKEREDEEERKEKETMIGIQRDERDE